MSWITDEIVLPYPSFVILVRYLWAMFTLGIHCVHLFDVHFCSLFCLEFGIAWNILVCFSHAGFCWILLSVVLYMKMIIIIVTICTLLYCIALNCIILYCIILYCIILDCIEKLYVILHYPLVIFLFALLANLPLNI